MRAQNALLIKAPVYSIHGSVQLPLSKSMSTRLLVLQHLSNGLVRFDHLAANSDVFYLDKIFKDINITDRSTAYPVFLDAGEGGAVMRFALAVAAITPGTWILGGSGRLQERPLGALVEALTKLGAVIQWQGKKGFLPLLIEGRSLDGRLVHIQGEESSQHISALCMIGPYLKRGLQLIIEGELVSAPYLEMTLAMMRKAGISVSWEDARIVIEPSLYQPVYFVTEADWSAAAFMYLACALSAESKISLPGLRLDSLQGDRRCAALFSSLGVSTEADRGGILLVHHGNTTPFEADLHDCPDLLPAMAVAAAALQVPARFAGLSHLRIKESDRISTVVHNLQICGFDCFADGDNLIIPGSGKPKRRAMLSAFSDHRIAMAFALLSLKMDELEIAGYQAVDKSWPEFWQTLQQLGWEITM